MSRHRVLAISRERDQLRRIVQALTDAGVEVDAILSTEMIGSGQIGHRYVFIDIGNARQGEDLEFVLKNSSEQTHVAIITDDAPLGEFTNLLSDVRVNHIISREELEHGVYVTAQKLLSGDIFGIERYLPEGTDVHYVRLNDFKGRGKAIDTVLEFAAESGVRSRLRQGIGQVCEELLMNALYDAPVDEAGVQVFAEIDPHDRVATQSPRPVSIRYAATDTLFAVAVRDRYGRLAKNTIIAYIDKCLNSPNQIDRKTYGAGLGLYMVANAAAGYIVNVAYGIATEVICTFDRKSKLPLRLVGVFVHPAQSEQNSLFELIALTPEELDVIEGIVRQAAGLDDERGDSLVVHNVLFEDGIEAPPEEVMVASMPLVSKDMFFAACGVAGLILVVVILLMIKKKSEVSSFARAKVMALPASISEVERALDNGSQPALLPGAEPEDSQSGNIYERVVGTVRSDAGHAARVISALLDEGKQEGV